jgi:hypothetical protein
VNRNIEKKIVHSKEAKKLTTGRAADEVDRPSLEAGRRQQRKEKPNRKLIIKLLVEILPVTI